MRKLSAVAVIIAISLVAITVSACGGGGDSSMTASAHKNRSNKQAEKKKQASSKTVVVNCSRSFVSASWTDRRYGPVEAETSVLMPDGPGKYSGEHEYLQIHHATQLADFFATPKGVRLKLGLQDKFCRGNLRYDTHGEDERFFQWNGKGVVPMTKFIRAYSGQKKKFHLRNINVNIYDQRYNGYGY